MCCRRTHRSWTRATPNLTHPGRFSAMRRVGAPNAEMEGDDGRPATRLKVEERSREEMGTEGAQSRPKRCQDGSLAKDEPPRKQPRLLRPAIPPPLPTDRGAYPGLKDKMSPPNRPPSKVSRISRRVRMTLRRSGRKSPTDDCLIPLEFVRTGWTLRVRAGREHHAKI